VVDIVLITHKYSDSENRKYKYLKLLLRFAERRGYGFLLIIGC